MTFTNIPHGKPSWDDDLNPNLQYLKDTAEAAETPAGAQAKATAAQNAAISAAATDATAKADNAQNAAISAASTDATTKANAVQSSLNSHTGDLANPHSVTKAQVGLGNVPNVDATARANHTGTQLASTISDLDAATGTNVSSGTQTPAALNAAYVRINKRPIHAADYGVAASNPDNTTALENAMAAAAGVALHLPAGDLTIAKASRLSTITTAGTTVQGDRSSATVLRFTNAAGGFEIGDGTNFVYTTKLANLIIDGNSACATPVRIRKGEELRFEDIRIQNATTANLDIAGTNLTNFNQLQMSNSPIGAILRDGCGRLVFTEANFSTLPEAFRVAGNGVSSFLFRDGWVEDCAALMTFNSTGAGFGQVIVKDSYFTTSSASSSVFKATAGTVSADPGSLTIRGCYFNWPSVTTPMVDFTAVDNSGATVHFVLSRLAVSAASYGTQRLIKPHAAQNWSNFYVDCSDIAGVPYSQWSADHAVTGGVRLRPLVIFDHGNPNTLFAAPVGSIYQSSAGGTGTSLYVKETGTGNTGWVAK